MKLISAFLSVLVGLVLLNAAIYFQYREIQSLKEENAVYSEAFTQFSLCWSVSGAVSYDGTQFRCVQGRRTKNLL